MPSKLRGNMTRALSANHECAIFFSSTMRLLGVAPAPVR
jgi:hypothetical protein